MWAALTLGRCGPGVLLRKPEYRYFWNMLAALSCFVAFQVSAHVAQLLVAAHHAVDELDLACCCRLTPC